MITYKLNAYGKEHTVQPFKKQYYNDNLAVDIDYLDEEFHCYVPFATMSVNLNDSLPEDMAYVDTNNCPWAEQFIKDNELGEPTGLSGHSGYCTYPLYRFNLNKLNGVEDTEQ